MIKHKNEMTVTHKEQMRGGNGITELMEIVPPVELDHSRLFSKITLPAGAGIGEHVHEQETEYYYILSGTGMVKEIDGEKLVVPGDAVITGNGASHSITNTGSEPLEFIAIIILND